MEEETMQIINTLNIDLCNPDSPQRIGVMQADANTRLVEVRLFHDKIPWAVPEGISAALGYRKPDGTAGLYDKLPDGTAGVSVEENRISVILAPQMLTVPGLVRAVVTLQDAAMHQLSTFPFEVIVKENPTAGVIVSENYCYYTNLDAVSKAIGDVSGLKAGEDLVSAINLLADHNGADLSQIEKIMDEKMESIEIPEKLSQLTNDTGFVTRAVQDLEQYYRKSETYSREEIEQKYLTEIPDDYAKITDIPAKPEDIGALPDTYTPPNQTAEQVGADPKGTAAAAVSQHNTTDDSHNDIRLELKAINDRLNAFFDSDDQTLDELSEIVAYITSNKSLIDSITTSKVSVADIINNLTTNVTNKPLSSAQGVVLKGLIDSVSSGLANCQPKGNYLTAETDPTVPGWAKSSKKPSYTASEVGAVPVTSALTVTGVDANGTTHTWTMYGVKN